MRILVACADVLRSARLMEQLGQLGHVVDSVGSESDTVAALLTVPFELAVVDLALGQPPGPDLVRRLRARAVQVPILALATTSNVEERVAALDAGSDDCISAPWVMDELLARVRTRVRRGMDSASNQIWHGPLRFNAVERTAHLAGKQLMLSRRELLLLEILIRRRGRFVSKEHVAEMMYSWDEERTTNSIEVYIHRLRKKVEVGPIRIVSSRGIGYQLQRIDGV